MMKKKLIAVLMSAVCFGAAALPAFPVMADGQKVVTLGADLSEEQRKAILNYFGIAGQTIETLTITNADERAHLGSYVPIEQIGTKTISCALVNPTAGGGIQVKTANLNWVTSNMIATTLSTSGVVNCEVVAAAPFEVSGTGALTGILMAYEAAVGTTLDTEKKEAATQELVTTTSIANSVGQVVATEIVNDTKIQVIQGNVIDTGDIEVIVEEAADEMNVTLPDEDRAMLVELLEKISELEYDYDEMKTTLERVESNLESASAASSADGADASTADETEAATPETEAPLSQDSILVNTDDTALGENVIIDATDEAAITPETEAPAESETSAPIEITVEDSYTDTQAEETPTEADITIETDAGTQADTDTTITDADPGLVADTDTSADNNMIDITVSDSYSDETTVQADTSAEEAPAVTDETDIPEEAVVPEAAVEEIIPVIAASELKLAPVTDQDNEPVYPAGQNELTISIPQEGLTSAAGILKVNDAASGSAAESVKLSDTDHVVVGALDSEELTALGWSSGSKITVYLETPLAQSSSAFYNYYITLENDPEADAANVAVTAADGAVYYIESITDSSFWPINTSEYGFYLNKTANTDITAGSTVSGAVMMDGTAAVYACIENADSAIVTFDVTEFTASGNINATFLSAGKTTFQISFYGEDGSLLNTIDYTVTVK